MIAQRDGTPASRGNNALSDNSGTHEAHIAFLLLAPLLSNRSIQVSCRYLTGWQASKLMWVPHRREPTPNTQPGPPRENEGERWTKRAHRPSTWPCTCASWHGVWSGSTTGYLIASTHGLGSKQQLRHSHHSPAATCFDEVAGNQQETGAQVPAGSGHTMV